MRKVKRGFIPSFAFRGFAFVFLIAIFRYVDGYSPESLLEESSTSDERKRTETLTLRHALDENEEIDYQRDEARKDLQKIFGITGRSATQELRHKTPPQFMLELYSTIADPSGVTHGRNPYNAKIVRSFVERGIPLQHLYFFEISGLEINESVIEAELHLFRKRSALRVFDPTILKSPYYLIRVYQVLEGQSMDEPDAHRLLNVHYVGAHASGWQVFNVKQAVLAWIAGAPNLGLMVTASNLFGDVALLEFSRRDDYHRSKQPILVLFDDDGRVVRDTGHKIYEVPHYYRYNDNEDDDIGDNEANDGARNNANIDSSTNEANNDPSNNEANNDPSNSEKEQENIDSEVLRDHDSGSTVDRHKRQEVETAIDEPRKTVAVDQTSEVNKEIDCGTQLGSNLKPGQTEFLQRNKKIGRKQNVESVQNYSSTNDANNDPSIGEKEQENIYSEVLRDHDSGSTVDRHKREVETAIEEPKKTVAVDQTSELNKEIDYGTQLGANLEPGQTEFLRRNKKIGRKQNFESNQNVRRNSPLSESDNWLMSEAQAEENNGNTMSQSASVLRHIRSAIPSRSRRTTRQSDDTVKLVPRQKDRMEQVFRSMNIYERVMLRQQMEQKPDKLGTTNDKRKEKESKQKNRNSYKSRQKKRLPRDATSDIEASKIYADSRETNNTPCARRELHVDFEDMGLSSSIIAPKRYSAFHCRGRCDTFLTGNQRTTNHATVQGIVHRMGLVRDVHPPCCVPIELRSITVLFYDDNENVVLKVYEDMVAERCGCR